MAETENLARLRTLISLLGIDPDAIKVNFDLRFKIQKSIRLLQLHPEISKFVRYNFNFYVRGPYSSGLAKNYYNLPVQGVELPLSSVARYYIQEIGRMSSSDLLLYATLAEVVEHNKGFPDAALISTVKAIKPQFGGTEIATALRRLRAMRQQFGLSI